jgi:hypothetical protein
MSGVSARLLMSLLRKRIFEGTYAVFKKTQSILREQVVGKSLRYGINHGFIIMNICIYFIFSKILKFKLSFKCFKMLDYNEIVRSLRTLLLIYVCYG